MMGIYYSLCPLGCLLLLFLLLISARLIPTLFLFSIFYAYFRQHQKQKVWSLKKLWIVFWIILLLFRLDVSFINRPGPPRVLRYVVGLPSHKTTEKVRRGEVILHGCSATFLEPFWVLVW